ncbi:FAD-binding oxidoreductase [Nakamurella deserti]|uniref:FAD-binding oxidoreductase n=1 Tax=Nakamurella deserti TaxID=2164074 RepID=UPI000DBE5B28|nr:FAD-binding oxidoreductase [Nakamurella deserti]
MTAATAADPRAAHAASVERLVAGYRAIPPGAPVRLAKTSSNLFRARSRPVRPGLDVRGLDGVLAVDVDAGTVDVGAMCTYETVVAATLPYGLVPTVVPQLRTITVGGAVTGLGIESSSFRAGLVHESVRELDILCGSGELVTATPTNAHADLFHGFPNSFGTLGYATRVRLELEPATAFVALRHLRCRSVGELQELTGSLVAAGRLDGRPVDYLDGVVFGPDESYLTVGTRTDEAGPVSDYTGQQIYYRSIRRRTSDRLTTADYLWRWDTDWFWCSRAFGAQQPLIRRLWPRRYRRSSVYAKLVALDRRWAIADRIERLHRRPALERVVQDVEIPLERSADFVDWFLGTVPIEPLWWCPLRERPGPATAGPRYPLYPLEADRTYVNVGFWSVVSGDPASPGATNRRIEDEVSRLGGHKSLYSDSYYPRAEFDARYGGDRYAVLKRRYDPQHRLLDLYAKAVQRR